MYQRRFRLVARIARVCIETGKVWEAFAGRSDDVEGSTSILNMRRMHRSKEHMPLSIHNNMAFATPDFLARIIAVRPTALCRIDALAVDNTCCRLCLTPIDTRDAGVSVSLMRSKTRVAKPVDMALDR